MGRQAKPREAGEGSTALPFRAPAVVAALLAVACVAALAAAAAVVVNASQPSAPADGRSPSLYVEDLPRDQPAPAWYDVDGDALALRIDEPSIASARVNNYPAFGAEGTRIPQDLGEATGVLSLVEGRTFVASQTIEAWNKEREGWVGGYSTSVEFFDGNGDLVGCVSYNPAFPGDGVAVLAEGTIYCMDGDQSEAIAYLDDLVARLSGLESLQSSERTASSIAYD